MKLPVFNIEPLISKLYIEQIGTERIPIKTYRRVRKSVKKYKHPTQWVFLRTNNKNHPVQVDFMQRRKLVLYD